MNRRLFLRSLLGAGAGAIIAPPLASEVWPFRKIFLPTFEWDFSDFITLQERMNLANPFYVDGINGISYFVPSLDLSGIAFLNLSRSPYPGRLNDLIFIPHRNPEDML